MGSVINAYFIFSYTRAGDLEKNSPDFFLLWRLLLISLQRTNNKKSEQGGYYHFKIERICICGAKIRWHMYSRRTYRTVIHVGERQLNYKIISKSPVQLHQICIGGENVGKISREKLRFYKKKKCCKSLSYSTLLFVEPVRLLSLTRGTFVPRAGVEPARVAPLVFETSASTDSAIWALHLTSKALQRYYIFLKLQRFMVKK